MKTYAETDADSIGSPVFFVMRVFCVKWYIIHLYTAKSCLYTLKKYLLSLQTLPYAEQTRSVRFYIKYIF